MLSPAAKKHFKLFRDPFQEDVTSPEDVFLSADQRYISEAMFTTAKHGGFLAVIGESGSGKTTLRKLLLERVRDQPIRVIFPRALDKTRISTGNLCQAIVGDLSPGQKMRSSLEAQARQVEDILLESSRADNWHVLLIEEAHDLSITTLKYLKRFYELEDGFRKLMSIILVGQPELKDKLDERRYPEAREVIRRIEIAELTPLDGSLEDYMAHKLKRVGLDCRSLFDAAAFDAIRGRLTRAKPGAREVFSQLYPLTVQNLVTKAMNRAADLGVPLITADLVREL
jgi:type II secretory pathway predicted ATPase ExeA